MLYQNIGELLAKTITTIKIDGNFPICKAPKLGLEKSADIARSIDAEVNSYALEAKPTEEDLDWGNFCTLERHFQPNANGQKHNLFEDLPSGPYTLELNCSSPNLGLFMNIYDGLGELLETIDISKLGEHIDSYVAKMQDTFNAASNITSSPTYIALIDAKRRDSHRGLSQALYDEAMSNKQLNFKEIPTDYTARVLGLLFPNGFAKGMKNIRSGNALGQDTYGSLIPTDQ